VKGDLARAAVFVRVHRRTRSRSGAVFMRRASDYAVRLREKQKLRHYFGLSERQIHAQVSKATARHGVTGPDLRTPFSAQMCHALAE
jgi:ribosomal protein S4